MHKANDQKSSCPDGYRPAGIVIPLRLTKRQEKYSWHKAVGIARAVYNLMVATHQFGQEPRPRSLAISWRWKNSSMNW